MSGGTIEHVQTMTVTLPDGTTGQYVVEEERADGSLVIRRQTYVEQLFAEDDSRPLSAAEFDELIAPHIQPPDGEG